jgi:F0F1-type ATP synthase assembly protein I
MPAAMVMPLVFPVVAMTALVASAVGGAAASFPQMIFVGLATVPAKE